MSLYELRTRDKRLGAFADDEFGVLDRLADLLDDGDEGNIEAVPLEEVEDYEPEGPG